MEVRNNELSKKVEQLEPKISVHILYGPHATESDVKPIENRFKTADIYIPEAEGWTMDQLQVFRMVSEGKITPTHLFQNQGLRRIDHQHFYAQLEMVKNSHKPITFIDVPQGHRSAEAFFRWVNEPLRVQGSFGDQLLRVKAWLKDKAEIEKEREAYMKSMLPVKIKEVLSEYPELKKKDNLNVLVALGSQHTRLYSELKQEGYDVDKEEIPSYGYFDEGLKAYMFDREIDDELAAKIFFEQEFAIIYKKDINGLTENVTDRMHLKQKIISQFSFEEVRETFDIIKSSRHLRDVFEEKLRSKGIKFPKSPAQLDEFLAKPVPRSDTIKEKLEH